MVRVTDRVPGQPSSSNPAQWVSAPSPDHSPSSSDDGTALPADAVRVGCASTLRRSTTVRWAATTTAMSPARASGSPTVTHRGGRPEGGRDGPAGGGRSPEGGEVQNPPPYGS